jgi:hypothetical protein
LKFLSAILLTIHILLTATAQDTTTINKKKLFPLLVATNGIYAGGLIYVSKIWYSKNDQTDFHFFNDLPEWKQMDKAGHSLTSFHESVVISEVFRWAGVSRKKSAVFGALAGFLYQAPIEILDGYGKSYGASVPDLVANLSGSAFYAGQQLIWDENRIYPKISFHQTRYPQFRPALLGKNLKEQILKDYNGQTYWLSFNIASFLRNKPEHFPEFINLSFGYGAEAMVYGRDKENKMNGFFPYRQYYLSLDIDLRNLKTKSKLLKILTYPLNIIHIPFPAVEFNKNGVIFHPIYF